MDLSAIIQDSGPPVTIISTDSETVFADGTVLYDNAKLIVESNDFFVIDGVMEYNGVEIRSTTGPVAVVKQQTLSDAFSLLENTEEQFTGSVVFTPTTIALGNTVQVVVRKQIQYGVDTSHGLILSSYPGSAIVYSNNPSGAELHMYGEAVVFDGLRLLQQNSLGQFYSFKGGGDMGDNYNTYLSSTYGYTPRSKDMAVYIYDSLSSEAIEERYIIKSGIIADALLTTEEAVDGRVANYFLNPAFDAIPKKKAVLLWSSRTDDRSTFQSVISTKKQQLIEQGYAPDDIQVLHFITDDEFFTQLDTVSDATYLEVVSHGWSGTKGGVIGTEEYYRSSETFLERRDFGISTDEVASYIEERKQKTAAGEIDSLVAQEGAFCTLSTCHSDATYSIYDPEHETSMGVRHEEATIAEAFTSLGTQVHVYGTIGPLWLVGYQNDEGKWVKDLVPVSDMTAIFEETANPSTETILTQDISYRELQ